MRNLSTHIHPRETSASTCEACGASFGCGAADAGGCWCAAVKLNDAEREGLRARYERCLCRACLESFAGLEKETVKER